MATAGMPAARRRSASRSVARSPLIAAIERRPRERARGGLEHRRLARARRAHQVDREHAVLAEVLAVVRRLAVVVGQDALVHVDAGRFALGSPQPQVSHITAPPSRCARARSRRPRPGAPARPQRAQRRTPPAARSRPQRGQRPARRRALDLERRVARRACARGRRRRPFRSSVGLDAGQLADAHPHAVHARRAVPRAASATRSSSAWTMRVLVHDVSAPLRAAARSREAGARFSKKALEALGEVARRRRCAPAARAPGRGGSRAGRRRRRWLSSPLATP